MAPGSNNNNGKESSMASDVYRGDLTPLQRHVAFFDRNKDGVIYPSETYEGFRVIGAGVPLSAVGAVFINGFLGPKTIPENEKVGPFKFPIYVKNIHKGKHGNTDTRNHQSLFELHQHLGWGGFTEWKVLFALCKDKDGFLHKETVRAVYDGSLFDRMEQERKAKESGKKK
ncbi:hypothetical protein PR202_ga17302 [Eleusine coracana subsp. coracana]|uniref:Uncharacterized protein n=1 Tax=Eleusine coracana subsp. coracana TaxID=191504 RepID=A0AAV5CPT1_ELECO|nr:hypothetical protein PR202_ga17302 [Eleusine coracana subsp. coracana]